MPYSKYESCYKDISFYNNSLFSYNDLCSIARDIDEHNLIESIVLIDEFERKGRQSFCYRVTYRSMDGTLHNSSVNRIQKAIRDKLVDQLKVEIR